MGRVAIVTGGSRGIGAAITKALKAAGHEVAATYGGNDEAAAAFTAETGIKTYKWSVADYDACKAGIAQVEADLGPVDILINNAGITRHARDHSDLGALSKQDFMDTYAVNVVGPFMAVRACEALLHAAYEQTGRASCVVNTSSIAGVTGIGSSVAYAATKGALNTMTLSLGRALAPKIRVNAVCPGFIGTRWFKDQMGEEQYARLEESVRAATPLQAASGPDDIADAALFFCADASRHVTGETLLVDAGTHLGYAPLTAR